MDKKSKLKREPKLTPKQKLFCDEWLIHRNATRAYLKAYGGTYETARVEGPKNLAKPSCREYLDKKLAEIEKRYAINLETCIAGLSRIAIANMLDYINNDGTVDLSVLDHDQAAAIQEITVETYEERTGRGDETVKRVKIKLHDKKGALLELGKHFGGFKTKVEHSVTNDLADLMKKARERSCKDG
nr:MAG TPA: Terminase small subunit [Caudoviricetes sp.]